MHKIIQCQAQIFCEMFPNVSYLEVAKHEFLCRFGHFTQFPAKIFYEN